MSNAFPGLKFFNLTTPEKVTIKTLELPTYDSEFYHALADRIELIIPTAGPTIDHTKNSTYPRCELRETLVDGTLSWWTPEAQEQNWLEYTVSVEDPGYKGKVIIGQIHGKGDQPPIKIQYNDEKNTGTGRIVFQSREFLNGAEVKGDILTGVKPGDKLKIRISLSNTYLLTVTINGSSFARQLNRQSYKDDRFYFKIGGYVQTEVNSYESTARVTLWSLDVYHGAAPVVTRTLADITEEIETAVQMWQSGALSLEQVEAVIQSLKVETDTYPQSAERSAVYQLIRDSRTLIRTPAEEPEEPEPTEGELIAAELDNLLNEYLVALITLTAAKERLNAASAAIKLLPDAAERLALNTRAAEVKAQLV